MYNNEAEIAYIRIWRLYEYVDYFIIIISPMTFSGIQNNYSFYPYEKEIDKFKDKIRVVSAPPNLCYKDVYKKFNKVWCRENSQRDYAIPAINSMFGLTKSDILLVSDADEIFTREALIYIRKYPPTSYYFVKGTLSFPYYFHELENWNNGLVYRYDPNNVHLTLIRRKYTDKEPFVNCARSFLTHCSYCFKELEQYKNKIKSFSHQEFNKPPYTTNDWIFKSHYCRKKINSPNGIDLPISNWAELIPDDPRLYFLIDPSFEYPIELTSYKKEDLKNLCEKEFIRTPFNIKKN